MTDTIRELILRVLDYVARTPGAEVKVSFPKNTRKKNLLCEYVKYDYGIHCISRNGRDSWSACFELTEDNLRYLVEQLEGEK